MTLESLASTSRLVELVSGVDALYASSKTVIPNEFFKNLITMKEHVRGSDSSPILLDISGQKFEVSDHAWGRYPVAIDHEFGRLGFTKSESLPGLRLQVRSKYLHAVGAQQALNWFTSRLHDLDIHPLWTLSRLDLFTDVQGWKLQAKDEHFFKCRASDMTSRKVSNKFSGFEFGRRKTGTINARIYDKTLEMLKNPNGWTYSQWGDRFNHDERVLRIEFEFHTALMREVGIITADQGLMLTPELWAYATDNWLTFRESSEDTNDSRWATAPEWRDIQNASLRGTAIAIERIRKREDEIAMSRLIPGLHGYLTSVGARLGATDLRSTLEAAFDLINKEEELGNRSTSEKLQYKKSRLGR